MKSDGGWESMTGERYPMGTAAASGQASELPESHASVHAREIQGWPKHEKPMELKRILEAKLSLLRRSRSCAGQIRRYLSTNYKDLRSPRQGDPRLVGWVRARPDQAARARSHSRDGTASRIRGVQGSSHRKRSRSSAPRRCAQASGACWLGRDFGTTEKVARKARGRRDPRE